jgi:hypothetical protein
MHCGTEDNLLSKAAPERQIKIDCRWLKAAARCCAPHFGFWALCWIVSLGGTASAQNQTAQFELASIREIVDGARVMGEFKSSGNRVEYQGSAYRL